MTRECLLRVMGVASFAGSRGCRQFRWCRVEAHLLAHSNLYNYIVELLPLIASTTNLWQVKKLFCRSWSVLRGSTSKLWDLLSCDSSKLSQSGRLKSSALFLPPSIHYLYFDRAIVDAIVKQYDGTIKISLDMAQIGYNFAEDAMTLSKLVAKREVDEEQLRVFLLRCSGWQIRLMVKRLP
ncbi:hypothetical protein B0H13DRAFT_275847 [Mycena leptocephala]|nr:hypothetical protein B0H13DRAFT_275847 [Mycena leptocephala]